jgi:integrase
VKVLLTDRFLRGLKPAQPGNRDPYWDAAVPGLYVLVTDRGNASFNVMRRVKGHKQPMRRMIGIAWHVPFPTDHSLPYPLATARKDARAMILDMAQGIDPKEKKATQRRSEAQEKDNSFVAIADEFLQRHVHKLRSGADIEATLRRELLPRWGERPISEISRRDIIALAEDLSSAGHAATARKAFSIASKLFNWALARDIVESSPCAAVKIATLAGAAVVRQRVLSDTELRALWQAVEGLGYPVAPFVRLLLLTGQRLREVAGMSWAEIDLDKALWTIPLERMKGGAAHEVPLAPTAVEILNALPRWTGPYVFSATGGKQPIKGFSKLKQRIDAALGDNAAPWRFHDLRRTMRTGLGALPVPNNVAELCIGHAQPGMSRVYDRHSYRDEKRRAFELWATRLAEITGA